MKIKPLYRLLFWLFLILLICFSALAFYLQHNQKDLFLTALRASLKQDISASDVDYDFPLGFSLDDFQIEGMIQAKKLSAQIDLSTLREKRLVVRELTLHKPIITWRNVHRNGSVSVSGTLEPAATEPAAAPPARLVIKKLQVLNGRMHYVNQSDDRVLTFQLDKLNMKIERLMFPLQPVTTTFQIFAEFLKEGLPLSGSDVKANGWINWIKKDMEAHLLILEDDGQAGLSAHAVAKDNLMKVDGRIKTMNLFTNTSKKPLESAVDNILIHTLSTIGLEVGANFSFDTTIDNFNPGKISFSGNVSVPEAP